MFDFLSTKGLPQTSLRKQVIDQGAHVLAGFAIAALAMVIGFSAISALVISIGAEIYREYKQNDDSFAFGAWSILDIAFWVLGAFLAAIFV